MKKGEKVWLGTGKGQRNCCRLTGSCRCWGLEGVAVGLERGLLTGSVTLLLKEETASSLLRSVEFQLLPSQQRLG